MVENRVSNSPPVCPMCGAQVNRADAECWQCGEPLRRERINHSPEGLSPARPVITVQLVFLMLLFFVRHVDPQAARNLWLAFPLAIIGFPVTAAVRIRFKQQTLSENRYALIATVLLSATTLLLFALV